MLFGVIAVKHEVIDAIDRLVDDFVSNYSSDWYDYDRDRVKKCNDDDCFVVMLRKTGVDTMFLKGSPVSYVNLLWSHSCLESDRSSIYLYYDGFLLNPIDRVKVVSLYDATWNSLPDEYVREMESSSMGDFPFTLMQWDIAKKVQPDLIAHELIDKGRLDLFDEYMERLRAIAFGDNPDYFKLHFDPSQIMSNRFSASSVIFGNYSLRSLSADKDVRNEIFIGISKILTGRKIFSGFLDSDDFEYLESGSFVIDDKVRKKALKFLSDFGVTKKDAIPLLNQFGRALFHHRVFPVTEDIKALGIKIPQKAKKAWTR